MKYLKIFFLICVVIFLCFAIYQYSKGNTNSSNPFNIIENKPITVLLFGDMMLDRNVRKLMTERGSMYPFENILEELKSADIVAANLEGVFTNNPSLSMQDNTVLRFTFDKKHSHILKNVGMSAVSQANNHTADFGREGLEESKLALTEAGIESFGDYFNENPGPIILERNKKKIAFVGFNEFAYQNFPKVLEAIKNAKEMSDYIIVMPHWGVEYQRFPSEFQRKKAYEFIDAGADVVIGAHPHVIEPLEIYKDKPIFYSLGNFIFDQNFSKETTEGLAVKIVIEKNKTTFELMPFNIILSQATSKSEEERNETLKWFALHSVVSEIVKEEIKIGIFEIRNE